MGVGGRITACFDEISHSALLERVRRRIGDRRVLTLIKAFLKAGILSEDGAVRDTITGTPQGGILSPLLSNLALSVLDEHVVEHGQANAPAWVRERRRRQGLPNYRIVRYADDFVVLVAGTRQHTEALREQVAAVLATVGLRLSQEKTTICHIEEGFDFLGWRIQRHQQRGSTRHYVYTYPSRKALAAVKAKVRAITGQTTNQPLTVVLHRLNWVLRGWAIGQDVRLPGRVYVASGDPLAVPQTPAHRLAEHLSPLAARLAADRGEHHAVRPGHDRHPALPLPRRSDPLPMGGRDKIGGLTHLAWACGEPGA